MNVICVKHKIPLVTEVDEIIGLELLDCPTCSQERADNWLHENWKTEAGQLILEDRLNKD